MITYRNYNPATGKFENTVEQSLMLGDVPGTALLLGIDGSSSNTGISVINTVTRSLVGTIAVSRDDGEDFVQYKLKLKGVIKRLMDGNIKILKNIFYEEPFVGFTSATEVLMAIRTTVREIMLEHAPVYDHIGYKEINNQRWKKVFLAPMKVPAGTDNQKAAVRDKVCKMFGNCIMTTTKVKGQDVVVPIFTEDEFDSIGIGIAVLIASANGDSDELLSKKKARPFKYNIEYIPIYSDDLDSAEEYIMMNYSDHLDEMQIPQQVRNAGVSISQLNGRGAFDKHIYELMGSDDKLVIVAFKAGKYVDAVIRNGRNDLCKEYGPEDYMIAVVWRKARKH